MSETGIPEYSKAELMVVEMARHLVDGDRGGVGTASALPLAAARLAQVTHAPNLSFFAGAYITLTGSTSPLNMLNRKTRLSVIRTQERWSRETPIFMKQKASSSIPTSITGREIRLLVSIGKI